MKTTNQIKGYALLGLMAALSLNLSFMWQGFDGSSTDASSTRESRRQDFKTCLKDNINAAKLTKQTAECSKKLNGREYKFIVSLTHVKKKVMKDGDGKIVGKRTTKADKENFRDALEAKNKEPEAERTDLVQGEVEDMIAEITVAADANTSDCDCQHDDSRTLSVLDKDFENISDLAREMDAMLLSANTSIDKLKSKAKEDRRIANGYKNCRNDEEGTKFKRNNDDIEEYFACVDYQSDDLEGRELANFMNNHVFPAAMQSFFVDQEHYQRYMEILNDNKDNRSANTTLDNLNSFQRDFLNRRNILGQTEEEMKAYGFPDTQIRQELNRINSLFDKDISANMKKYAQMQPAYSTQYMAIDQTMKSGRPPYTEFGSISGSAFSNNSFMTSGSSFTTDSARLSLGLTTSGATRPVPSNLAARNRRGS